MRRALILTSAAALLLSMSVAGAIAHARTPTPTATASPSATPTPPSLPDFDIWLWVDGHQSGESIVAKIGDVVCGGETQSPGMAPDSGVLAHFVRVKPATSAPGCGTPGATVTFLVDGRQANQTARWLPGQYQFLILIVGPPFARFAGNADLHLKTGNERVIPFIGETACGYQENSWQGAAPPYGYGVVVYSSELQAGCGYDGAEVTFKLLDEQGNVLVVSQQTGIWHAWGGTIPTYQSLDLTMVSVSDISVGSMGDGGSPENDAPVEAALGLALAGVATLAVGVALRRRANSS